MSVKWTRLYIIGNGFDLHHGIPSAYKDLKAYTAQNHRKLFNYLDEHFYGEFLWCEFEEQLGNLDFDELCDYASQFLTSYGSDDWSDSANHDYEYEIQSVVDEVVNGIRKVFPEWVFQLDIDTIRPNSKVQCVNNSPDSFFINFNYTETLERHYGAKVDQILYIHSKSESSDSNLVIGHSQKPKPEPVYSSLDDDPSQNEDIRVVQGKQRYKDYLKDTYKPVENIIQNAKSYFSDFSLIQIIYVLGHSIADVDIAYFKEVITAINVANTKWIVSYYSPSEADEFKSKINSLGVPITNITLKELKLL